MNIQGVAGDKINLAVDQKGNLLIGGADVLKVLHAKPQKPAVKSGRNLPVIPGV